MTTERQTTKARQYRILMQTRPNVFQHRGGDTIVLERLSDGLSQRGHAVTIDIHGQQEPSAFDVVHLFNFATPDLTRRYAECARSAAIPYVVTTLYEDRPLFQYQSHLVAGKLIEYVAGGQRKDSFGVSYQQLLQMEPCPRFAADDIARHAAALLPNGNGEGNVLRRDYPYTERIMTVPVGSEIGTIHGPELFERVYGERDFVLCVGRLESRKNQLMLLKALEDSPLTVILAGGGFSYQPEYEAAIRAFKRRGKTIILGMIDPQMLSSAYAACKIHVLPSWYELPGLVSLEAAAHGKNIVVTRTGTTADYVGDKAFYCSPWDSDSIESAVTAAYYSPVREGVVEMARSHSWTASIDRVEEVYQAVVTLPESSATNKIFMEQSQQDAMSSGERSMNETMNVLNDIILRGESAAKASDFETADMYLAQAEQMDPQSTRVLKARGAVLLAQMKPVDATAFFDRALEVEPDEPKLLAGRGMCDLLQNKPDAAIDFFERALKIEPDYLVALYQLLECAYGLGEYPRALSALTAYLTSKPDDTDIRFCLAGCLYKSNNREGAERELERIVQVQPDHPGARELRRILERGSDASQAEISVPSPHVIAGESGVALRESLADLSERVRSWKVGAGQKVQQTEPPQPSPSEQRAQDEYVAQAIGCIEDLKRSGDFTAAINQLSQLLGHGGVLPQPYREIAQCLEAEFTVLGGDLEVAGHKYDEILRVNPASARALCGKGALAAEAQDWKIAAQYFSQAIANDSDCDVAFAGLGLCAMTENNTERAFEFFQTATEKNPENHRALLGLLQTGYPLKRYTEMERMLTAYLDLHPASLDMLYSFAGVLYAQGKVNEARLEIEKILVFEPAHEHALELRGMINSSAENSL